MFPEYSSSSSASARSSFLHLQIFALIIIVPTFPMLSQLQQQPPLAGEAASDQGYLGVS